MRAGCLCILYINRIPFVEALILPSVYRLCFAFCMFPNNQDIKSLGIIYSTSTFHYTYTSCKFRICVLVNSSNKWKSFWHWTAARNASASSSVGGQEVSSSLSDSNGVLSLLWAVSEIWLRGLKLETLRLLFYIHIDKILDVYKIKSKYFNSYNSLPEYLNVALLNNIIVVSERKQFIQ